MKKRNFFLLLAIVLIIFMVPFYSGMKFQGQYEDILEELSYSGMRSNNVKYNLGWRSSEIETNLNFTRAPKNTEEEEEEVPPFLTLITNVKHGPFYDFDNSQWMFLKSETKVLVQGKPIYPENTNLSIIKSTIGLDSNGYILLDAPAILKEIDGGSIEFSGMIAYYDINPDISDGQYRFQLPSLIINQPDYSIDWTNMEGTINYYYSSSGLLLSDGVIKIKNIQFNNEKADKKTIISNIELISESDERQGVIGGSSTLSIDNIDFQDKHIGPVTMDIVLGKVNAKGINIFNKGLRSIMKNARDKPEQFSKNFNKFLSSGGGWMALSGDPYLKLDRLRIIRGSEEVSAGITVKFSGIDKLSFSRGKVLEKLNVSADIKIPKIILKETLMNNAGKSMFSHQQNTSLDKSQYVDGQIIWLIQNQYFKEAGDNYISKITFNNGALELNDNEIGSPIDLLMNLGFGNILN
jgi:uncharacterized protein YdgA (DUF945 family)